MNENTTATGTDFVYPTLKSPMSVCQTVQSGPPMGIPEVKDTSVDTQGG